VPQDNPAPEQKGKFLDQFFDEFQQVVTEEKQGRKPSVIQEEVNESSSGSDSGQSEDNLEPEELVKILPKRLSRKKTAGSKKRKPNIIQSLPQNKKTFKDEKQLMVIKENQTQLIQEVKRKNSSQRGLQDFKKPT